MVVVVVVALIGLFPTFGVLLGRFRYDETFFIHSGWSAYQQFTEIGYFPTTINQFLKLYWTIIDGDMLSLWRLRLFLLIFVVCQLALIVDLVSSIELADRRVRFVVGLMVAIAFVTIGSGFRGYEVRPEIVPNTVVLLAVAVAFKLDKALKISVRLKIGLLITSIALVVSGTISLRHAPGNALLLLMLATCTLKIKPTSVPGVARKNSWIILSVVVLILIAASGVFVNYFNDITTEFDKVLRFQSAREQRSWLDKLTIGGASWHLELNAVVIVSCILLFWCANRASGWLYLNILRSITLWLTCVAAAFYAFLYVFDSRPFEYIRSIEWTLLFVLCISAIRDAVGAMRNSSQNRKQQSTIATAVVAVVIFQFILWTLVTGLANLNPVVSNHPVYIKTAYVLFQSVALAAYFLIHSNQATVRIGERNTRISCSIAIIMVALIAVLTPFIAKSTSGAFVVLILILSLIIVFTLIKYLTLKNIMIAAIVAICCSYAALYAQSVKYLFEKENPFDAVKALYRSTSLATLESMRDLELAKLILSPVSVLDQTRSRAVYCARHPQAEVLTYMWSDHPICMKDGGSFELSLLPFLGELNMTPMKLSGLQFIALPLSAVSWTSTLGEDEYEKISDLVWIKRGD